MDRQIIRYKRQGFGVSLIARALDMQAGSVSYRIKFMKERFGINFFEEDLDEIDKVIIDYKNKGISNTIIAKNLGVSVTNISNRVKRIIKETPTKKRRKSKLIEFPPKKSSITPKDELVYDELKKGLSNKEISQKIGMSETEVSRRKKKIESVLLVKFPVQCINETDELIMKLKEENLTDIKIGEMIGMTGQSVGKRIRKIDKITKREIAKGIINLIATKHATIEQVKEMGKYYGVDVEELLNSIDEQER